jgi:hypothetical protein
MPLKEGAQASTAKQTAKQKWSIRLICCSMCWSPTQKRLHIIGAIFFVNNMNIWQIVLFLEDKVGV